MTEERKHALSASDGDSDDEEENKSEQAVYERTQKKRRVGAETRGEIEKLRTGAAHAHVLGIRGADATIQSFFEAAGHGNKSALELQWTAWYSWMPGNPLPDMKAWAGRDGHSFVCFSTKTEDRWFPPIFDKTFVLRVHQYTNAIADLALHVQSPQDFQEKSDAVDRLPDKEKEAALKTFQPIKDKFAHFQRCRELIRVPLPEHPQWNKPLYNSEYTPLDMMFMQRGQLSYILGAAALRLPGFEDTSRIGYFVCAATAKAAIEEIEKRAKSLPVNAPRPRPCVYSYYDEAGLQPVIDWLMDQWSEKRRLLQLDKFAQALGKVKPGQTPRGIARLPADLLKHVASFRVTGRCVICEAECKGKSDAFCTEMCRRTHASR